jgi:hypothetical protein
MGVNSLMGYSGTTTNQDAYKAYDVHPREQHHVDYTYNPTPFEGSTESHDAFKQWQLEKRAAPPSPPMRISLPFEGKLSDIALFTIIILHRWN